MPQLDTPLHAQWTGGVTNRGKKLANRKVYRITLGAYPAISRIKACAHAAILLADTDNGVDPIARLETVATVRRGTIAALAEDFHEHHCRARLRSASEAEWVIRDYVSHPLLRLRAEAGDAAGHHGVA